MRIRPLVIAIAIASVLSGCASLTGPDGVVGGAQSCVSWVGFADAQEMYDDATVVVVGVADPADGTIELISGPGERHRVAVEQVLKGGIDPDELRAAAPRDYCVADPPQPAADPIPDGERVILFLHPASADAVPIDEQPDPAEVEAWSTLTPEAGVLAFPEGAELPFTVEGG